MTENFIILKDITGTRKLPIDMQATFIIQNLKLQIWSDGLCFLFKFENKKDLENTITKYKLAQSQQQIYN